MAREKLGKKKTTIGLPPDMIDEIKGEADKSGLQWTAMVPVLVREALERRKVPRQPQASDT